MGLHYIQEYQNVEKSVVLTIFIILTIPIQAVLYANFRADYVIILIVLNYVDYIIVYIGMN